MIGRLNWQNGYHLSSILVVIALAKLLDTVPDNVWNAWLARWATPEAKAKSATNSANRWSAPAGQDGPVLHTGGSRSAYKHKIILV